MPEGVKFNAWLNHLLEHPAFKSTCSKAELYLDSYERQAPSRSSVLVSYAADSPYTGMHSTDRILAKSRMRSTLGGACLDPKQH